MADDSQYDLVPVPPDYDPFAAKPTSMPSTPLTPEQLTAAQRQVIPSKDDVGRAALNALGPLGEAGDRLGEIMRTGQGSASDIAPIVGGAMLGVAGPKGEGIAENAALAAEKAAAPTIAKAIRAYHGSPYDFDKFDISKIGTGEGAQAYGHGLYFAEEPAVAWSYRFNNAPSHLTNGADSFARQAASLASDAGLKGNEAKRYALDLLQKKAMEQHASARQPWFDAINNYDTLTGSPETPGKMYEVNINADPEHFLDWDKPLSEQHPKVQDAMRSLSWMTPEHMKTTFNASRYVPSTVEGAKELQQAGIPGIKYLDQGSRNLGPTVPVARQGVERAQQTLAEIKSQPNPKASSIDYWEKELAAHQRNLENALKPQTYNYVVFDPKTIDIIKKYGLAGLIAGGGAHFATQQVDYDPFGHSHGGAIKRRAGGPAWGGKVTKDSVHYRDGSNAEHCGNCSMYKDHTCSLVRGIINPAKTCDRWDAKTEKRAGGGPIEDYEDWRPSTNVEEDMRGPLGALADNFVANVKGTKNPSSPHAGISNFSRTLQDPDYAAQTTEPYNPANDPWAITIQQRARGGRVYTDKRGKVWKTH